jgi:hypothetical protein
VLFISATFHGFLWHTAFGQLGQGLAGVFGLLVFMHKLLDHRFVFCRISVFLGCHVGSLRYNYRDYTDFHVQNQVVWRQTCIRGIRAANGVPTPLDIPAAAARFAIGQQARLEVTAVRTRIAQALWVIHREHTQLQLWLIWLPTLAAHQDFHILGLDDERLELFQTELKTTAIAYRNGLFA